MLVSAVFTILKKNGEHRLILNPISIESMSQGSILKMEGAHMLPDILEVQ